MYSSEKAIVIRTADDSERTIDLPELPLALTLMNESLVQVHCASLTYALDLRTGTLAILPEDGNE